jgi:hypothetical protein
LVDEGGGFSPVLPEREWSVGNWEHAHLFMDDSGTVVAESDLSSQEVVLTGGGGSQPLQEVTIDISTAAFTAWNTSPIEVLVGQGAGTAIIPVAAFLETGGTQAFGTSGGNPTLCFLSGGNTPSLIRCFREPLLNITQSLEFFVALARLGNPQLSPHADVIDSDNATLLLVGMNLSEGDERASDPLPSGTILTTSVGAGGSGYAPGDTGSHPAPNAFTYEVDTVDGGGAVTAFHVTSAFNNHYVAAGLATEVATGVGDAAFTVNIDSITSLTDMTGRLTVLYHVLTLT